MPTEYLARAKNELTEHLVYHQLALREKNPENRALLEHLSAQEKSHYEFWKKLAGGGEVRPYAASRYGVPLLRTVFGVTFITKFLESHEEDSVATYERMLGEIPEEHRPRLREIIEDERNHERSLISGLAEKRVAYVGFIALGLADAIVEITGVHAGFLGVTGSTLIAGISGVIVGFAAAISMGSAAYLQAKQDAGRSAITSAFVTGISYLCSVVVLALPYFLIRTMLTAFAVSTSAGLVLLATFTFYGAVLFDRKFPHEFAESASLMLGTALATFLLGNVIGGIFHLTPNSF
ncbi:MAG TPA: VIT1/CCC1 family protein [Candidatus Paceibacterota bacterium]|nr:VIT1/CCC1 family protein [Candidatus Paceibacterota bacterium]